MKTLIFLLAVIGVAPILGVEPAASNLVTVTVNLTDGSRVVGRLDGPRVGLEMQTEMVGRVNITWERIRQLDCTAGTTNTLVTLQNGDKLQGRLFQDTLKLTASFGPVVIPTKVIRQVSVGRARAGKLPEGCVLWYSFDVDEGERTSDQSGREHHGQVRGAEYVAAGKFGGAYRFARGEKQLWVADSPDWSLVGQPFTIALWVKLDGFPDETSEAFIIGHDEGGGGLPKWGFEFFRDGLCFHVNGPHVRRDQRIVRHRFRPELNRWYHLAVSRDARTFRLFVDGECVKTEENPAEIPAIRAELTIGQAEGLGINGLLDEVMLFKRCLTAPEVAELAAGHK